MLKSWNLFETDTFFVVVAVVVNSPMAVLQQVECS